MSTTSEYSLRMSLQHWDNIYPGTHRESLYSWVLHGSHMPPFWDQNNAMKVCLYSVPPETDRKGKTWRWNWRGWNRTQRWRQQKESGYRYRQRKIPLCLTFTVKSNTFEILQIRPITPAILKQFVRDIITFWIERALCRSEVELQSSAKFLPLEFGLLRLETYALYTSLDRANALLYFLNQTPTGV